MTTTTQATLPEPTDDLVAEATCLVLAGELDLIDTCEWDPEATAFNVAMVPPEGPLTSIEEFEAALMTTAAANVWDAFETPDPSRTWRISYGDRTWSCSDAFMYEQPTHSNGMIGHLTFIEECAQ